MERWQGHAGIPKTFVTGRSGWCWTTDASPRRMAGDHLDRPESGRSPRDPAAVGRRTQIDKDERPGLTTEERERLMQLEREDPEVRRASQPQLKSAAPFFGAELDGRHPR